MWSVGWGGKEVTGPPHVGSKIEGWTRDVQEAADDGELNSEKRTQGSFGNCHRGEDKSMTRNTSPKGVETESQGLSPEKQPETKRSEQQPVQTGEIR